MSPIPTIDHTAGLSCSSPIDSFIFQLALDLNTVEKQLVAQAESISRKMNQVAASVRAGGSTNSLGEVQGAGQELDRLCQLRATFTEQMRVLKAVLEAQKEG
jgi:hypothetical protein